MGKFIASNRISIVLAICVAALTGCGAPIFHPTELWTPAPDVIAKLRPYLDRWATSPPSATEAQRTQLSSQLKVSIGVWTWNDTLSGRPVTVVEITLNRFEEYSRGYLYVHDNEELKEAYRWQLRPVEDHLY